MEEGAQESHGRGDTISTTWTPGYGRPWGGQLWTRFSSLYDLASQAWLPLVRKYVEERCAVT